jgi:hypothetical protein
MRVILSLAIMVSALGVTLADDKDEKKSKEATITKLDTTNKTLTVKCKDGDGKEVEKTYKLVENIKFYDSEGKVASLDIFKAGHEILLVEADNGALKEMRRKPQKP